MEALAQREPEIDISGQMTCLAWIIDTLESCARSSEPMFIEIGAQLQAIFENALNLEKEARLAVEVMGHNSGEGVLDEVCGLTTNCVKELRESQALIDHRLAQVRGVAASLGNLAPISIELKKFAKQLRTINVYFAVESSRYDESAKAFSAYTQELSSLVQHILSITSDIERDSVDAQVTQTQAYESILKGATQLNEFAFIAECAMTEASSNVDMLVESSNSAMAHIAGLSNELSVQMGKVVQALQFHDIVRQQLEHVAEAVRDANDLAESMDAAKNDPDKIARIHSILVVQAAQLHQATSTVRNAHATINQSFKNIGRLSSELLTGVGAVDGSQIQASDLRAGLCLLGEALETLRQLLEDVQGLAARTSEAAGHASNATMLLSEHAERIDDVNMDINIQALNAVITSVRLAERGNTLAILAQEVTTLSLKCNEFVGRIMGFLKQINTMAAEMSSNHNSVSEDGSDDSTSIISQLSIAVERINDACSNYENYSMTLQGRAREVQTIVEQIGTMLDFLPSFAAQLEEQADALTKTAGALRDALPEDYSADALLMDDQQDRYTMASERDTHMRVLGSNKSTERREETESTTLFDASNEPASAESDDLGDNVELF